MKIARNDPCPCGSGKKFKKCCLRLLARTEVIDTPHRASHPLGTDRPVVDNLVQLRAYANAVTDRLALLRFPRVDALLHSFRLVQARHHRTELGAGALDEYGSGYRSMRNAQDLLRWLTYKLFERCPEGGTRSLTSSEHLLIAVGGIEHFSRFAVLHELIVSAEMGFHTFLADSRNGRLEFITADESARVRLINRLAQDDQKRLAGQKEYVEQIRRRRSHELREGFSNLTRTLRVDRNRSEVTYEVTDLFLNAFFEFTSSLLSPPELPDTWSLGSYTLAEFRRFWVLIRALASLDSMAYFESSLNLRHPPHNSAAMVLPFDILLKRLRLHAALPDHVSLEILRDLTYNHAEVSWTDIMYQPLVPLDAENLLTLPLLLLGSNFERNLFAIVDRLPWRRDAAATLKNRREELMIDEIAPVARLAHLACAPRVPLRKQGEIRGDIDLLLWDPTASSALCVSLKWFYGPDSMKEVANHDEWYREALQQCRDMCRFVATDPLEFSRDRSLHPSFNSDTHIFGVIVSKRDTPSEAIHDETIPIVTMDEFLTALRRSGCDLHSLVRDLIRIQQREPSGVKMRSGTTDFAFGDFIVRAPVLEIEHLSSGES